MVASYSDYPMLLRALGLVIDCALEKNDPIDTRIAAGGGTTKSLMSLSIKWSNNHDPATDTTPRTAWQADKERFFARPRGNDLERGLLKLLHSDDSWGLVPKDKPGLFDLYQVDPDGTALKTVGFTISAQGLVAKSLSIRQIDGEVTYTTGDKQPVAALRSGGLGMSRHGRAAQVAQDAAAADLKNHGGRRWQRRQGGVLRRRHAARLQGRRGGRCPTRSRPASGTPCVRATAPIA